MKKRSILVIIALVLLLIIAGCDYEKKDKTSDALKFKNEYESINGDKVNDLEYVISEKDFLGETYIIVKRGKKNYYIGIIG